jgi:TnpA family transposase
MVASLQTGIVMPPAMLRKLVAYERQNQLDLALQGIGRVERTLFMLDRLESPRCDSLICTFKQGRIADRTYEA